MSLSERISLDRRAILLAGLALTGCGFRPIYGSGAGAGSPSALFGSVRIANQSGELNFAMRDALIKRLGPARAGAPLLLTTSSRVSREGVVIDQDDVISRYNLRLVTQYTLTRDSADAPVSSGQVRTIAAYNATATQYATLVAEREVERRAALDIAERIMRRLSIDFQPDWLQ